MLFNSYIFILAFLPVTLLGFIAIERVNRTWAIAWLLCTSVFFYGWWNYKFVGLIFLSIAVNYSTGAWLGTYSARRTTISKWVLSWGIVFNLGTLGYFKYINFLKYNLNSAFGLSLPIGSVILPIGISFYTFIQIAYLVDSYRRTASTYSFLDYALFVVFFPHLIAGPIIHHQELIPQFKKIGFSYTNISVGLTIFFIGLFKKIAIADNISLYANAVFDTANKGVQVTLFEAWAGALAYTFQIYFDFSGYSDMAIGLARLFNINFPTNFNSPYKASSIIDFWRRWHMTLSRYIRDYLYIPLGGNRKGKVRQYANLLVAMLIAGLWHGAGWTYVVWGGLHGCYLMLNHLWRWLTERLGLSGNSGTSGSWFGRIVTFLAVIFAWVVFRAKDMQDAISVWKGMVGLGGVSIGNSFYYSFGSFGRSLTEHGVLFTGFFPNTIHLMADKGAIAAFVSLIGLWAVCWFFPNTQQVMRNQRPTLDYRESPGSKPYLIGWRPNVVWLIVVAIMATYSLSYLDDVKEFLYYQF